MKALIEASTAATHKNRISKTIAIQIKNVDPCQTQTYSPRS